MCESPLDLRVKLDLQFMDPKTSSTSKCNLHCVNLEFTLYMAITITICIGSSNWFTLRKQYSFLSKPWLTNHPIISVYTTCSTGMFMCNHWRLKHTNNNLFLDCWTQMSWIVSNKLQVDTSINSSLLNFWKMIKDLW